MKIPLSAPDLREEEIELVAKVLRTPHLSLGPKLPEFERAIAEYIGTENAIGVSSGTAGLHLCVRALDIGAGDEVIVPSFAFVAVANVLLYENAVPVLVDIEADTLNLDARRIEAAITPRTKAILVVHTFGCPAEMSAILDIARRRHLYVLEDACEAIGAEYQSRKVGGLGDAGVFGFYPNKQITTGEGGMVVTRNSRLATRVRALRNQGRASSEDWFQHSELGYNYRLSEINCALGIGQLSRIEATLAMRGEIAKKYNDRFQKNENLRLPVLALPDRKISWFVYVVRLSEKYSRVHRDWIMHELNRRGIGCGRYFAPIHLQPAYQNAVARTTDLRVTESQASRCLALPFFNRLQDQQIDEVCHNLCELIPLAAKSASATGS
ncbi:MAG TPA: DegT/DnrJ/EryC1/StrS family aminotransferase [Candidatus Eremiobacteraceae bacterium]|nr:DegT/DnrJ/EryC1/StrS family aminotransferase [Candidatus Eremiobacteraceae bacterium]